MLVGFGFIFSAIQILLNVARLQFLVMKNGNTHGAATYKLHIVFLNIKLRTVDSFFKGIIAAVYEVMHL